MGGANRNTEKEKRHQEGKARPKDGSKKKLPALNNINLPYNMLRKLPGHIHPKRRNVNKRRGDKEGRDRRCEEVVSDPFLGTDEDDSGSEDLNDTADLVTTTSNYQGHRADEVEMESREVCEARKLIAIGVDLRINFQGGEEENVKRMLAMEERDRLEKAGMENNTVYQ
jgi:hypothetical protein